MKAKNCLFKAVEIFSNCFLINYLTKMPTYSSFFFVPQFE